MTVRMMLTEAMAMAAMAMATISRALISPCQRPHSAAAARWPGNWLMWSNLIPECGPGKDTALPPLQQGTLGYLEGTFVRYFWRYMPSKDAALPSVPWDTFWYLKEPACSWEGGISCMYILIECGSGKDTDPPPVQRGTFVRYVWRYLLGKDTALPPEKWSTFQYLELPACTRWSHFRQCVGESGCISIGSSALYLGALCSDKYLVPECHQEQNKHEDLNNEDIKLGWHSWKRRIFELKMFAKSILWHHFLDTRLPTSLNDFFHI